MKLATTIGEMYAYTASPADAVRQYEGTGFHCLDYSFYSVASVENHPFMGDGWKQIILDAKAAADELGFTFVQAHSPDCAIRGEKAELGLRATLRSIEACGMLGIRNMVIHSGFFHEIKRPDGELAYFEENEPFMRALIPAMEEYNVNVLFENTTVKHCKDGLFFPVYGKELNDFVEFMGHPLFGAAWDVGHAHMDGIDQYTEIMTMGKNLKAIHVHDNDGTKDRHLAPFLGTLDYDSMMRGLIESGFDGYFTFESDAFFKRHRAANLQGPLAHPTLEIKKAAVSMLHLIGKTILDAYGVYEE